MWKEHFNNLLGKFPRVPGKPVKKINNQLDIKLGRFTKELKIILTKIEKGKLLVFMEDKEIQCPTAPILQSHI